MTNDIRKSKVNCDLRFDEQVPDVFRRFARKEIGGGEVCAAINNAKGGLVWSRLNSDEIHLNLMVEHDVVRHTDLENIRLRGHKLAGAAVLGDLLQDKVGLRCSIERKSTAKQVGEFIGRGMSKTVVNLLKLGLRE